MGQPLIFLAAGEVSGDVHGAALVSEIRGLAPDARFAGLGSHKMAAAGVEVLQDLTPYAAVGLTENLAAVRPASEAIRSAREYLAANRPSAVVLIDYQGANMVLARHAREAGIPTLYYISPQEWIWGFKGGAAKVARQVDRIVCIFEREAAVYRQAGGNVTYVGHPLLDQAPDDDRIAAVRERLGLSGTEPVLGLFPGSRKAEIGRLLPPMLGAARALQAKRPGLRVLLPIASPHLETLTQGLGDALTLVNAPGTPGEAIPGIEVLAACDAALVASGTATLEAAIVGTPVVATYRVSALTAFLARKVFRIGHVSLPNIVADREVIPELLQENATAARMVAAVEPLLDPGRARQEAKDRLAAVAAILGERGATRRAAECVLEAALAPTR
ncbi:MAG: lipid-A-disaccharide synthase [Candidatus Sericytochromatia bacterium]|uniref:Lipid-A-disaccharide synthase n=1 Tax=Candidatus Tanganyikabacteria bacterium TaxID=2961651 RepID=A0A938BMU5_9BACT|nr:lipid-A-disaccharide synthase [Candidatus Tanganyikabacteria bacterium]